MGHLLGVHKYKNLELVLAFTCLVVICISLYIEHKIDLLPCPLCIMQRFCLLLLLLTCVICYKFFKKRIVIVQIIIAFFGCFFASRQLWLEHHYASDNGMCMPWQNNFGSLILGSADCGASDFIIAGLSMAGWSLVFFVLFIITNIFMFFRIWQSYHSTNNG